MKRLSPLLLTGLCLLTHSLPHQYHFIDTPLPWLKAQTYCRERHTDLATVFNIEDMNRLVNTAQYSTGGFTGKAWIGLYDDLTSWRWSFSDSRYYGDKGANYRNWDFGQPDNFLGEQMCVKMWSGGVWEDSRCFLRNPFICYDETTTTDQRFIFVEQELSWFDAQLYCRGRHTDLASVRDEKENQEIQRLANNKSVWIGLFRTREWSDQSISTYSNWGQGQPDNVGGKQNCTATDLGNAGLWSDEECSRKLVFICYGENVKTPDGPVLFTTVTPKKITTTEEDSTTTEIISNETPNQPGLSTPAVTVTKINITASERDPTGTEMTSKTPNNSFMSTTKVIPQKGTTTEIKSTTGHVTTEITSSEQHLMPYLDQTTPITNEISNQPALSTIKMTTIEDDSTSTEVSSQHSTPKVDQTDSIPAHVINLRVKFTSRTKLSEEDISELLSVQFHKLLTEIGLPTSIKVDLKKPIK